MHQTVDASLNSSTSVGIAILVSASSLSRAPKVKTKFFHAMGMTFTTITGVAEVKVMALSAVISENKKMMKHIDDSFFLRSAKYFCQIVRRKESIFDSK